MHLEILVEDQSGKIGLEEYLEKFLGGTENSYRLHAYKGIGRIPPNLRASDDPRKRLILNKVPALLAGYGRSLTPESAVVVVVDLDSRDRTDFEAELQAVLDRCNPRPRCLISLAIEETEAWLLGDRQAVEMAYPHALKSVLDKYVQDSQCGTWELLADAVYPGGAKRLKDVGYPEAGRVKCEWAERIAPLVDCDRNRSPSFQDLRSGVADLVALA